MKFNICNLYKEQHMSVCMYEDQYIMYEEQHMYV